MTNREKAIKKIIRKLNRVIGLHVATNGHAWAKNNAIFEQRELVALIRSAIETDWEP